MYNKDGVISQDYYEHGMKLYTYKHVCVCPIHIIFLFYLSLVHGQYSANMS